MDDLFQQQMESILLNEVEYVIKEEIRDISSELFVLEIATDCLMEEVLLEMTIRAWKKKLYRKNGKWLLLIMQRVSLISL